MLARCRDAGVDDVALEVSSHGLALHRVAGTRFRTAVFTNLSPDHLDLHGDLESYYAAKASLFTPDAPTPRWWWSTTRPGADWPRRPPAR